MKHNKKINMHYFSHITFSYTCKNKLHKEILNFLYGNDRKIIQNAFADEFRDAIISEIGKLNSIYNKCKPVHADWWSPDEPGEEDYTLHMGSGVICNFHLYKAKN